jgi:hypothetical protein
MASKVQRVKIYYTDGREVEVKVKPRAMVATERHIGGEWQSMAVLSVFYMAWCAVRLEDKEAPDFDTWLDTIDDVEQVEEKKDPDPTELAQSTDSLLN